MDAKDIIREVKQRKFHPVYFFCGEESYFTDLVSETIEKDLLSEAEKGFNQSVFYGKDADVMNILNSCKRFPMMSAYQLVWLKEAQGLKNIDRLLDYIRKPLNSTVLLISYKGGKPDGRTEFGKSLKKNTVYLESKPLYENQVADWIRSYVEENGYRIGPKACALLAEYLGNDLSKISNELDKLCLGLAKASELDAPLIEKNIGISREFNVFELNTALGEKNVLRSNQIIQNLSANPKDNPLVLILGSLVSYFSKLLIYHSLRGQGNAVIASALGVNPYFLKQYETGAANYPGYQIMKIISKLRLTDLASKGVDSSPEISDADLLRELIYHILH